MGCCLERIFDQVVFSTDEANEISEETMSNDSFMCSMPNLAHGSSKISNSLAENVECNKFDLFSPSYNPVRSGSDFRTASMLSISEYTSRSVIPSPPITEVTSQLYLGSWDDAKNEEELRSRGITHTLSLIGPKHLIAGIEHKHYPMSDWGKTDLRNLINNTWNFVEGSQRPGNALFVHCMSGQNRSATVIIAILMRWHGESLDEAFKDIKYKRPIVQIHEQYAKQLSQMEQNLHGRKSVTSNWMKIRNADMSTGSVAFYGDSMISFQRQNLETKEVRSSMSDELEPV